MMRTLTISFVMFLLTLPSMAATVKGTVVIVGNPLPGAIVTINAAGTTRTTVTDMNGRFHFENVPEGTCVVSAELSGLKAKETKTIQLSKNRNLRIAMTVASDGEVVHLYNMEPRADGAVFTMYKSEADKLPIGH
jgi:hypothetical protein